MIINKHIFDVYKSYLIKIAQREGRPFRLPKNTKSLEERQDSSFFVVLSKKLKEKHINEKKRIEKFIEVSEKKLEVFHITTLVTNFDDLYESYKEFKEDNFIETKRKIKIAFDMLINYCIINNIESEEELIKGNPPLILKIWKEGKLDERVLVTIYDLGKLKTKPWFRVYCGELASKYVKLEKSIKNNVDLSSFIEAEQLKFKTIFIKE